MKLGNKEKQEKNDDLKIKPPTVEEIDAKMDELTKLLEQNLSFWKTFKISIVRGFGTALGATVLIAAAIYLLDQLLGSVEDIPLLTPILEYLQSWLEASGSI